MYDQNGQNLYSISDQNGVINGVNVHITQTVCLGTLWYKTKIHVHPTSHNIVNQV